MSEFNDFNKIIDDQINRATKGLAIKTDIQVMKDFKRLAELGCFNIIQVKSNLLQTEEDFKRASIEMKIGLSWDGEKELTRLKAENFLLTEKLDSIFEILKTSTDD